MRSRNWVSNQVKISKRIIFLKCLWQDGAFHTCDKVRMGIFSMPENIILSLKFYLVFFIFLENFFEKLKFIFVKVKGWKCLLVRLNLSRLPIIHSRSKFNFLKQFLCHFISFKNVFEKLKFIFVKVKGLER